MATKPSNAPLIAAVGVALLLLLGANIMAQKNNPEIQEKLEKEKEAQAQEKAAKEATAHPAAQEDIPGSQDLVMLGDRATLGKKDAKVKVTIGYGWTPQVQGNPGSIYNVVNQLKKVAPDAAIEIVNVDSDPNVPRGISVNGKTIVPLQADGTINRNDEGMMQLMSAIHQQKMP